jgi:rhodanese-related sulfurtransferase
VQINLSNDYNHANAVLEWLPTRPRRRFVTATIKGKSFTMSDKRPQGLTPNQAWQMMQDDPRAILVDIRSSMEYLFVGHPKGSVHIAWIDEPEWTVNPHFITEIRKLLLGGAVCSEQAACAPVILICRSGKRSLDAGQTLLDAGLSEVYHIDEGFEGDLDEQHHRSTRGGWRFHGLPWEQC